MPDPDSTPRRPDAPALQTGWADKTDEELIKKPVYLRGWFLQLMVALLLIVIVAGTVGGAFLYRWHREQQAELASQRRSVEAFVRSPSFEAFAREADAQLVAALNFANLRPDVAGALLPDLAAAEKSRHQMPWALELSPLPVSTAQRPVRVREAVRTATDLLAQRGLAYDQARLADARRVFLRLLTPHARTFLAENTGSAFPALFLDRRMQDIVLTAYATRADGTRDEAERMFVFYGLVGPALWQELEGKASSASPHPSLLPGQP